MSAPTEDPTPTYAERGDFASAETEDFADAEEVWEPEEEQAIVRRPRRRLLTPVTALLFALLLGAGGFIIGVEVEKGEASTSGSTRGAGRFAGLLGAASAGAAGGSASAGAAETTGRAFGGRGFAGTAGSGGPAGAGGAGTTAGQVAYISGSDLYVTDLQGNTVKVAAAGAQISRQVMSSVKGVHPGDTVIVQGAPGAKGSIVASTVRDSGSSSAGIGGSLFGSPSAAGGAGSSSSRTSGAGSGEPALFGK